ncbi:GTP binding protein lepa [Scenedesmus sp. NREL 46B-D3]|nr:GTP binding protein lepa [Scenedesmus sp. NREL 46B-D3]
MQLTGAVPAGSRPQYLDKLQVERERGITIKAQTASLVCRHSDGRDYLLNLIDTPGHVDFSYEVSRSLAACQGALLLVDASQGVQAQTVANFYLAFEQELALLPLLNKMDLPSADPVAVTAQMAAAFDVSPDDVLAVSAKTGYGLQELLPAVIGRVPPPAGSPGRPLRLLLFDAFHDEYRGVVCLVAVVDGRLRAGDRLAAASSGQEYEALEVGMLAPEPHPTGQLLTGQVGYVIPGIKDVKAARVGDTWHLARQPVQPLPGFKPIKPMVFAGLYPASADEYEGLSAAIERLGLNDASVTVKKETSDALGAGFRCGFLGPLHLEVFLQRLQQEHKADVISTAPTVPYEVELAGDPQQQQQQQGSHKEKQRLVLESVAEYPRNQKVSVIHEPTVLATIIVPQQYCGAVMKLAVARRGTQLDYSFMGGSSSSSSSSSGTAAGFLAGDRVLLRYQLPLAELAGDFYSKLKSATQGYASFDYEEGPLRPADLTLLELVVNGKAVDALARLVPSSDAVRLGRSLATRMRELLDRQQYEVAIQAVAGGRIVARETMKALRKDVLAKCYGGDVSRKRKLLQKQKEGKKRLRQLGGLSVPAEVFPELLKP